MSSTSLILLIPFLITQDDSVEFVESEEYRASRVGLVIRSACYDYSQAKELGLDREEVMTLERRFPRSGVKNLKDVENILSPKKVERVVQVANQYNYRRFAVTNGLLTPGMKIKFKLKGKEEEIKKIENQITKELLELERKHRREMEELLTNRDTRIKRVLGPKNANAYRDYFGKPFWLYAQRRVYDSLRKWPDE